MTGMKEGAGEDPFAEDFESEETESTDQADTKTSTDSASVRTDRHRPKQQQTMRIPYIFRRDGVHDGRDRVPLFLQDDTKSAERDALRELEDRFDDDVSLTDLREAVVKVGLEHIEEVEGHLEEWGYGMTFNE